MSYAWHLTAQILVFFRAQFNSKWKKACKVWFLCRLPVWNALFQRSRFFEIFRVEIFSKFELNISEKRISVEIIEIFHFQQPFWTFWTLGWKQNEKISIDFFCSLPEITLGELISFIQKTTSKNQFSFFLKNFRNHTTMENWKTTGMNDESK